MPAIFGIRRETKSKWERRVPLTPDHVRQLIGQGHTVIVQPSPVRIFPDEAYAKAGATVQEDLTPCATVFAVKEIPEEELLPGKTYVFFSHTIKGQEHNMPLLAKLLRLKCRLIDYERIADETGRRMIFFGRHAGYAGMIDTLQVLGQRLQQKGQTTPFAAVRMAHQYADLTEATNHLAEIGKEIVANGLQAPLVIGLAGYGNVSQGAHAVLGHLPIVPMTPAELLNADTNTLRRDCVYVVVFKEADLVEPLDPNAPFDLKDYYARPNKYIGRFHHYLDRLAVVVNCIYWESRYPRLITREELRNRWANGDRCAVEVVGDLGCDIGGPIEFTLKATTQEQPTFVYLPAEDRIVDGLDGDGPVVLAVDNLPCELPAEASQSFGDALLPFVGAIVEAADRRLEEAALPAAIERAVITDHGDLTAPYRYLVDHLQTGANR